MLFSWIPVFTGMTSFGKVHERSEKALTHSTYLFRIDYLEDMDDQPFLGLVTLICEVSLLIRYKEG